MLTPEKIKQAIIEGESLFTEFKESFSNTDDITAEIAALANTEGGMIIFGVKDNGEIKGISADKKIEETIMNLLRNNIEPSLTSAFLFAEVQGKIVGALEVPKSLSRPHRTNRGQYFIRVGTTKRYPSREELNRIYQDAGYARFDIMPIQGTSINDLDLNKINQYYRRFYQEDIFSSPLEIEQLLVNLEFLTEDSMKSGHYLSTTGGILLFGKEPQKYLSQSAVSIAKYEGNDLASPLKNREELKGTIFELLEKTVSYIKSNMKIGYEIIELERKEIPEYPLEAIREVITNAISHRNYSITGEQIRVFMFSDKLWVSSPGRLPNTITLDTLFYRRHSRNPLLVDTFLTAGLIEKSGSGIWKIKYAMQKHNQTEPKFELFDEEFRVTLWAKK